MNASEMLAKLALEKQGKKAEDAAETVVATLILGETITVTGLSYYEEKPSPKGDGKMIPARLSGYIQDLDINVRLQNEDADLWYEGLTEAAKAKGFKGGVLKHEDDILDHRLKGAKWIFDVEPAFVGKAPKLKEWKNEKTGNMEYAYDLHGGMLAGPVTLVIREHKPPRKAVWVKYPLGDDE